MSTRDFIIFILIVVDLLLALWVRRLEKNLDDLLDIMYKYLDWHKEQRDINRGILNLSKDLAKDTTKLSKQSNEMLDNQITLNNQYAEVFLKIRDLECQINHIRFEMDKDDTGNPPRIVKTTYSPIEAEIIDKEKEE